jgi:molecular chaperone IbpA
LPIEGLLHLTCLIKGEKAMTRQLTPLSIFNQLRPVTIGFDNVFDHFERMMGDDHFFNGNANYPPYNIVKTGDYTYDLELALAGFSKKDIDVAYEDGMLTVKSNTNAQAKTDQEDINGGVLHKGISKRFFSKSFTIADDVEIKGAELKDGLLRVTLERIIPENKKPRSITIK